LADQTNYGLYLADLQNIAADQTNYALYLTNQTIWPELIWPIRETMGYIWLIYKILRLIGID